MRRALLRGVCDCQVCGVNLVTSDIPSCRPASRMRGNVIGSLTVCEIEADRQLSLWANVKVYRIRHGQSPVRDDNGLVATKGQLL